MLRSRLAASAKCGGGMRCGHHQVLGASLGASLGGSRRIGPAARAASSASTLSTSTASRLPLGAVFAAGVTSAMWWGICAPDARCRDVFEEQPAVAAEAVEQALGASREWLDNLKSSGSTSGSDRWVHTVTGASNSSPLQGKRVLILAGAEGDKVEAVVAMCEEMVSPMLQALGGTVDSVHKTDEKPGARSHARDVIENGDLSELDGIIVVGGDRTFGDVIGGLATQSELAATEHGIEGGVYTRTGVDVLRIPVGYIPAGSSVSSSRDDQIRAALKIAQWTPSPVEFMQCQTDTGIVTPAISSGARFATEEQIANNKVRWDRWTLRYLPNLSRKLVEMWAVFRMHKYHFRVAYLPADAKSPPPTFESWDEAVGNPQVMSHQQGGGVGGGPMTGQTGEWQVLEGDFVAIAMKPDLHNGGSGAQLSWAFDDGQVTRAKVEQLVRTGAPDSSGFTNSQLTAVKAFSITSEPAPKSWKRRCSIDGEACEMTNAGQYCVRGRMHEKAYMRL